MLSLQIEIASSIGVCSFSMTTLPASSSDSSRLMAELCSSMHWTGHTSIHARRLSDGEPGLGVGGHRILPIGGHLRLPADGHSTAVSARQRDVRERGLPALRGRKYTGDPRALWDTSRWNIAGSARQTGGRSLVGIGHPGRTDTGWSSSSANGDLQVRVRGSEFPALATSFGVATRTDPHLQILPLGRSLRRRRRNDLSDSLVLHSIARSSASSASVRRSRRARTLDRAV